LNLASFQTKGDILEKVAEAVLNRNEISPNTSRVDLVFVGLDQDPKTLTKRFRSLQESLFAKFGVKLLVVGGGFGCEKTYIKIVAANAEAERKFIELILRMDGDIIIYLDRAGVDRVFEKTIGHSGGIAVEPPNQYQHLLATALKNQDPLLRLAALIGSLRTILANVQDMDSAKPNLFKCLEEIHAYFSDSSKSLLPDRLTTLKNLSRTFTKRFPASEPIFEAILGTIEVLVIEKSINSGRLVKTGTYEVRSKGAS